MIFLMPAIVDRFLNKGEDERSATCAIGHENGTEFYFSADVETDGPIPGPYSMLSFGLVYAGSYDGKEFQRPNDYSQGFYRELKPISENFEAEALKINGLNRDKLLNEGSTPEEAMMGAGAWVKQICGLARPVLVAYPLSFDWAFLYWYFVRYSSSGSPFSYSHCFDIKTAYAVKAGIPIISASRSRLKPFLRPNVAHTHNALEDAIEQAEVFANLFEWRGQYDENYRDTPRNLR